jgi:hypothetical protein
MVAIEQIRSIGLPTRRPFGFEAFQCGFFWKVDRVLIH